MSRGDITSGFRRDTSSRTWRERPPLHSAFVTLDIQSSYVYFFLLHQNNTVIRQDTFLQDTQLYSHISANAAPYHTMYIHDVFLTSHKLSFRSLILCTLESFSFFFGTLSFFFLLTTVRSEWILSATEMVSARCTRAR